MDVADWPTAEREALELLGRPLPGRARQARVAYRVHRRVVRIASERPGGVLAAHVEESGHRMMEACRMADVDNVVSLSARLLMARLAGDHELAFVLVEEFVEHDFRQMDGHTWTPAFVAGVAGGGPRRVNDDIHLHALLDIVGTGTRAANHMGATNPGLRERARVIVERLAKLAPDHIRNQSVLQTEAAVRSYWQLGRSGVCGVMPVASAERYLSLARTYLQPTTLQDAALGAPLRVVDAQLSARLAREHGELELAHRYDAIVPVARKAYKGIAEAAGSEPPMAV
jgi:hypothetical protein